VRSQGDGELVETVDGLKACFRGHEPELSTLDADSRASVALVMREEQGDLSLLFIQRAVSESDRWSGHIAFPGGRVQSEDAGPRETAERETREEVGLDLAPADYVARLDDLVGHSESILVSGFVYTLTDPRMSLVSSHEVEHAFWLRLGDLEDPARHVERSFRYLEHELPLPAIQVLEGEGPVLWGLSYQFLQQLMQRAGRTIPPMPWHRDL
jgi:8-oxo-dGTP pyrophosphatase MutT (NUDIX family)